MEDNIKELKVESWRRQILDKKRWRKVIEKVKNFQNVLKERQKTWTATTKNGSTEFNRTATILYEVL